MKNIVICADGTWNSPLQEQPTNVLRIARAIADRDDSGAPQVVFYDWGVGSYYDKVQGGVAEKFVSHMRRFRALQLQRPDVRLDDVHLQTGMHGDAPGPPDDVRPDTVAMAPPASRSFSSSRGR